MNTYLKKNNFTKINKYKKQIYKENCRILLKDSPFSEWSWNDWISTGRKVNFNFYWEVTIHKS